MRVAVISDMHGNAFAFDAALDDIRGQGVDQIVCLGDTLQGGPQPAEVANRLRELGCPVVIGNADAYVLSGSAEDDGPITELQAAVREWSVAQLGDAGLALIEQFQPTVEIALPGGRQLLCFHGSPTSYNDVILPGTDDQDVERLLGPFLPAFQCGGHTHLQQLRRIGDAFFFNPGSVGLAYDPRQAIESPPADRWAEYAILSCDETTFAIEFKRLPYDIESLVSVIRSNGMPFADVLAARYGG